VTDLKSNSGRIRTSKILVNGVIRLVMLLTAAAVTACGGGGGSSFASPLASPPPSSGWQQGVFLDFNTFFARCAVPRTGTDPSTGQPFQDIQGTTLDENNFLRSYSDDSCVHTAMTPIFGTTRSLTRIRDSSMIRSFILMN
jgi:hypothetical protein